MAKKYWKLINKKVKKHMDGKCHFCDVSDYSLLDVHRIVPGEEGGIYTEFNTVTVCANHHRSIHSGEIKIDRKYMSTRGWVLHYWDQDGNEKWD